jgi:hypothetical protein
LSNDSAINIPSVASRINLARSRVASSERGLDVKLERTRLAEAIKWGRSHDIASNLRSYLLASLEHEQKQNFESQHIISRSSEMASFIRDNPRYFAALFTLSHDLAKQTPSIKEIDRLYSRFLRSMELYAYESSANHTFSLIQTLVHQSLELSTVLIVDSVNKGYASFIERLIDRTGDVAGGLAFWKLETDPKVMRVSYNASMHQTVADLTADSRMEILGGEHPAGSTSIEHQTRLLDVHVNLSKRWFALTFDFLFKPLSTNEPTRPAEIQAECFDESVAKTWRPPYDVDVLMRIGPFLLLSVKHPLALRDLDADPRIKAFSQRR